MQQNKGTERPLILQVGSRMLFSQAHIPGSEYIGPGSQPAGIQQLQNRVNTLSRKKLIVLYCGCCPLNRCPNLGPAFAKLHEMGFTNVKVLYLAYNFGADWADKGYPLNRATSIERRCGMSAIPNALSIELRALRRSFAMSLLLCLCVGMTPRNLRK